MHAEVEFDDYVDSHLFNFIHFVEYLYNGLISIEIINVQSSHSFGSFQIPLRNLIRKRKN